jgi:hypothetical protein
VTDEDATAPDEEPAIGAEALLSFASWLLKLLTFLPCPRMSQIRAPRAHSTGSPTPIPTPSATFPVVDKPTEEVELAAVGETKSVAEAKFEEAGVARLDVFIEVAVVAVDVIVVDEVVSVMLKYVETKPSGPSGFTQKKNSFEYDRSKPRSWTVQVKFVT